MSDAIEFNYINPPTMLMPDQKKIINDGLLKYLAKQKLTSKIQLIKIETRLDEEMDIVEFTGHLLHKKEYRYDTVKFTVDFVKKTLKILTSS